MENNENVVLTLENAKIIANLLSDLQTRLHIGLNSVTEQRLKAIEINPSIKIINDALNLSNLPEKSEETTKKMKM